MNVEAFRKTIRRRMMVMAVLGVGYALAALTVHLLGSQVDFAGSFLFGSMDALVVFFVVLMPRYRKALRDEKALARLWNQEHDERMQAIKARAGAPMLVYTSIAMIAAGVLVSPWHVIVAMTLLIAAAVQLLVCATVKLICMRTM